MREVLLPRQDKTIIQLMNHCGNSLRQSTRHSAWTNNFCFSFLLLFQTGLTTFTVRGSARSFDTPLESRVQHQSVSCEENSESHSNFSRLTHWQEVYILILNDMAPDECQSWEGDPYTDTFSMRKKDERWQNSCVSDYLPMH